METSNKEKKAVADTKKMAKVAAGKVTEAVVDPLFKVDFSKVFAAQQFPRHEGERAVDVNVSLPALCNFAAAYSTWKESPRVVLTMSNYGGQYKKQETVKSEGRGQYPLVLKEGKEETDDMYKVIHKAFSTDSPAIAASDVPNGSRVLGNTWAYGYMPDVGACNITPYGVTMAKVLLMGAVKVVASGVGQRLFVR